MRAIKLRYVFSYGDILFNEKKEGKVKDIKIINIKKILINKILFIQYN